MTLIVLSLIPCLIGLWLGTGWIMRAAFGISQKFGLSHGFVGIAVLAVGSDLPEVFVSVKAAFLQLSGIEASGIITGNALGSSIAQITLVLGVASLINKSEISRSEIRRDMWALIAGFGLLFICGLNGVITRAEGSLFLLTYVFYYWLLIKNEKKTPDSNLEKSQASVSLVFYLVSGLLILIVSSHYLVENTMVLAEFAGFDQSLAGIAIVGVGTSLPELAISIAAARKKSAGMAIGNIIGSNIFDGLIPFGVGGLISTINVERKLLLFDLSFLFIVTALILVSLYRNQGTTRSIGLIALLLFVFYITAKIISA